MALFVKVARLEDLPPGTGMMVVGPFDKPMALFNVGGEVFAINAVCPHRGGPLANGRLDGHIISSPARGMAGPSMSGPASPIMVADTA
jgi:nitrite reductase/ring-hydroxylating ferredoxin subunit